MVLSPDHHYLYLVTADTCPPEKRDLTQPGYPVVVSGPAGGYVSLGNIGGMPVVTPDDAHILIGGTLIDTATMQQTANYLGGAALPSANPDRYYLADATGGGSSITTMELHDLKAVSTVINGCLSIGYGVHRATISGDEKIVITIGDGGGICVTQIAQ